jgi:hypothetical protein
MIWMRQRAANTLLVAAGVLPGRARGVRRRPRRP